MFSGRQSARFFSALPRKRAAAFAVRRDESMKSITPPSESRARWTGNDRDEMLLRRKTWMPGQVRRDGVGRFEVRQRLFLEVLGSGSGLPLPPPARVAMTLGVGFG